MLAVAARWTGAFALVVALHIGLAAYLFGPSREIPEAGQQEAVEVDLVPDHAAKPDEVAGPEVADAAVATSEQPRATDPDPPAPDAPPPTEVKREPTATPPEATAPPAAFAEAVLPPDVKVARKPEDRPPDPPRETPLNSKDDMVERRTAPSQASAGSAALLAGGRRPSLAAEATWRGAIGTHLARHRRYPGGARALSMQGIATVRVTIDGGGRVLGRDLLKSSGRPLLDGEALALVQRSDPFPRPPPGLPTPVVLSVPVSFAIR